MNQNQTKRIGDFASTIFILILLGGILAFYYFKYVPDRKAAFNRNAFLELSQIETALQSKSKAYRDAFQNIIPQGKIDRALLLQFNFKPVKGDSIDIDDHIMPGFFNLNDTTRRWELIYPIFDNDANGNSKNVGTLSKDVDTLLSGLVSTYRDIFDGYLLIQDVQSPADSELKTDKPVEKWERSKAKIIYRSADLSMNYPINPDSLLKRNRSLSQMNILDITIEGNLYKLFVYPFEMYDQKLTLTGLISDSNYREVNQKIPFGFFSVFMMLLLLLVIHLPILRIYALGPDERIRAGDIRMIIGSYFVAAFF
jgi:cbb3-type cytochrome oxidase subunit 3